MKKLLAIIAVGGILCAPFTLKAGDWCAVDPCAPCTPCKVPICCPPGDVTGYISAYGGMAWADDDLSQPWNSPGAGIGWTSTSVETGDGFIIGGGGLA